MSRWSRCEWLNLVLAKLVKLKGLESIWLDVVKIVGDAYLGFSRGDAARTMNGNRPKHTTSLLPPINVHLAQRLFSCFLLYR